MPHRYYISTDESGIHHTLTTNIAATGINYFILKNGNCIHTKRLESKLVVGINEISNINNGFHFVKVKNIASLLTNDAFYLKEIELPYSDPKFEMIKCAHGICGANKIIVLENTYDLSNINTLKMLVEQGADIHCKHDYLLRWYVKQNNHAAVKYLLDIGANINAHFIKPSLNFDTDKSMIFFIEDDDNEMSAIELAICRNHKELIKYLIDHGANIHINDDRALIYSCMHKNNNDIIKILLDANCKKKLNEAYFVAVRSNHLTNVKTLVENNDNIDINFLSNTEFISRRPLIHASWSNDLNMVKYLVDHGADITLDNYNAIITATKYGNIEIVKYLVDESNADINICNIAMGYAVSYSLTHERSVDLVKYFHELGADINNGDILRIASIYDNYSVVEYLLKNGVDVNIKNGDPLRSALRYGKLLTIKYLIDCGADPNFIDKNDLIPSIIFYIIEIFKYLYQNNLINFKMYEYCFIPAAVCNFLDYVKYFIEIVETDINEIGKQAIRCIVIEEEFNKISKFLDMFNDHAPGHKYGYQKIEVIQYLIDNGVEPDNESIDAALKSGNDVLINFFKQFS